MGSMGGPLEGRSGTPLKRQDDGKMGDRSRDVSEATPLKPLSTRTPGTPMMSPALTPGAFSPTHRSHGDPIRSSATPHPATFVFDWDDTLVPTSALLRGNVDASQLEEVGKAVALVMDVARQLRSQCLPLYIVTAATEEWVMSTTETCFPSLKEVFLDGSGVEVIYARAYRAPTDTDEEDKPREWKRRAVDALASTVHSRWRDDALAVAAATPPILTEDGVEVPVEPHPLHLIGVGDCEWDLQAVRRLADGYPGALVKTVKLLQHPTSQLIVSQLRLLAGKLVDIARAQQSMTIQMSPRTPPSSPQVVAGKDAAAGAATAASPEAEGGKAAGGSEEQPQK